MEAAAYNGTFLLSLLKMNSQTNYLEFTSKLSEEQFSENVRAVTMSISRQELFCNIGVPKNFAKLTGKHLCRIFFLNEFLLKFLLPSA